jgi:xylulokinase
VLAGIDLGTSSLKVVLTDEGGRVLGAASAAYPLLAEQPGQAEQHPDDWWRALQTALAQALAQAGRAPRELAAIGLCGQMHGVVPVDAAGRALRRAILWLDQRGEQECRQIEALVPPETILATTGSRPSVAFSAAKLLWLQRHEPAVVAQSKALLQPKDYLRLRLGSELATDPTDGSGTLLLDLVRRDWSDVMLERLGIDRALLPPVRPTLAVVGQLSRAAADELGLAPGVPLVCGAGDTAAQAAGYGATQPGITMATVSSGGQLVSALDRPLVDPLGRVHTLCHVLPDRWYALGALQAAGLALQWFRDWAAGDLSYDALLDQAATVAPGADGLIFLPYLLGERTPHLDNDARGVFFGLTLRHTHAAAARAVLEGVAFAFRDALGVFHELGLPLHELRLGGGGGQSALWRRIFADVLQTPIMPVDTQHGAALGAALLAGVGVGRLASLDAAPATASAVPTEPDHANARRYDAQYAIYRELYGSLRPHFHALARLHSSA